MRMVDLIVAKRNGDAHSRSEVDFIVSGITDGSIPDYQVAAWLMAIYLQGMTISETAFLTDAMCKSGEILDLSEVGPLVGDKHSTGGVGDKTTLVFVPMMAAAGVPMAKLSGRGLGHAGGTIDKLEAIPGFNTNLSTREFIAQVKEIGMAIGAQTQSLAPADKRMYALRDVTGTVESIPLLASSVMSKKIAAGANLIILDVKCGHGAYLESLEDAQKLAQTMADIGRQLHRPVSAVVTDMDQPLGNAIGHTLEVIEAIECLKGSGPKDLRELCLSLGAFALVTAGKAKSEGQARLHLEEIIDGGAALENFKRLIRAQNGNADVVSDYALMPTAPVQVDCTIVGGKGGFVSDINGRTVAEACKLMGAGRARKSDQIDLGVGVVLLAKIGSKVEPGQPIARIHANTKESAETAKSTLARAFTFIQDPVGPRDLIKASVG
jgi:pyrimidine-nucleoside phosphorylase